MEFALDLKGLRVSAHNADKEADYICPICRRKVFPRQGKTNVDHFAHEVRCNDSWTYEEMSEWHREWQSQFPCNNREVVVELNGERHRTDVMAYGYAVEFQHSTITAEEFDRRNDFYLRYGKKVIWIFDAVDEYSSDKMQCYDGWSSKGDNGGKYSWRYPKRFLKGFIPQKDKNIIVFFQIADSQHEDREASYIERITWAIEEEGESKFTRFCTSYYPGNKSELLAWMKDGKL